LNNSRRQKERRPVGSAGDGQTRHTSSRSLGQDTAPQTPLFIASRDELDAGQVFAAEFAGKMPGGWQSKKKKTPRSLLWTGAPFY
jgi:hypothetical protein